MKQKKMKRALLVIILLTSILLMSLTAAADDPTITVDPAKPKPQGTVTFTVSIPTEETITQAVIYVEECESGLCFTDNFNKTMTNTGSDTYESTITLKHSTAVEMKYKVGYATSSGWTWYPADAADPISVDLDTENNDGENNGDGAEKHNESSASFDAIDFGLYILLIIIVIIIFPIIIIYFTRKKQRRNKKTKSSDEHFDENHTQYYESDSYMDLKKRMKILKTKYPSISSSLDSLLRDGKKNSINEAKSLLFDIEKKIKNYESIQIELKDITIKIQKLSGKLAEGEIDTNAYNSASRALEIQKKSMEEKLWHLQNDLFETDYEKPF